MFQVCILRNPSSSWRRTIPSSSRRNERQEPRRTGICSLESNSSPVSSLFLSSSSFFHKVLLVSLVPLILTPDAGLMHLTSSTPFLKSPDTREQHLYFLCILDYLFLLSLLESLNWISFVPTSLSLRVSVSQTPWTSLLHPTTILLHPPSIDPWKTRNQKKEKCERQTRSTVSCQRCKKVLKRSLVQPHVLRLKECIWGGEEKR